MTAPHAPFDTMTSQQAEAITALIRCQRPEWDAGDIRRELGDLRHTRSPYRLALAALTLAANPVIRSISVLSLDGPHWRVGQEPRTPADSSPASVTYAQGCADCGKPDRPYHDRWDETGWGHPFIPRESERYEINADHLIAEVRAAARAARANLAEASAARTAAQEGEPGE